MARIVIALGGNSLGNSAKEQLSQAKLAAKSIVDLVDSGNQVVIGHGNGPQVGQIRLAFEELNQKNGQSLMPFAECTAMSQGYIGYHLQQAINEELINRSIKDLPVVTMLTQVVVDSQDLAFSNPTKPVGAYYDKETAKKLMANSEKVYKEDAGRGWRRVVASPKPIDIYEKVSLKLLVENNQIIIACGGGGIPIAYSDGRYHGVDAVIDKDFAAAKMAELVNADIFIILTAVDHVFINFGSKNQKALKNTTVEEVRHYIKEQQFATGSMLPKVEAGIEFAQTKFGRKAVIASLEQAAQAMLGKSGTTITM